MINKSKVVRYKEKKLMNNNSWKYYLNYYKEYLRYNLKIYFIDFLNTLILKEMGYYFFFYLNNSYFVKQKENKMNFFWKKLSVIKKILKRFSIAYLFISLLYNNSIILAYRSTSSTFDWLRFFLTNIKPRMDNNNNYSNNNYHLRVITALRFNQKNQRQIFHELKKHYPYSHEQFKGYDTLSWSKELEARARALCHPIWSYLIVDPEIKKELADYLAGYRDMSDLPKHLYDGTTMVLLIISSKSGENSVPLPNGLHLWEPVLVGDALKSDFWRGFLSNYEVSAKALKTLKANESIIKATGNSDPTIENMIALYVGLSLSVRAWGTFEKNQKLMENLVDRKIYIKKIKDWDARDNVD